MSLWVHEARGQRIRLLGIPPLTATHRIPAVARRAAERYFGGGRFWQIPRGLVVADDNGIVPAIDRPRVDFRLAAAATWAATPAPELRLC